MRWLASVRDRIPTSDGANGASCGRSRSSAMASPASAELGPASSANASRRRPASSSGRRAAPSVSARSMASTSAAPPTGRTPTRPATGVNGVKPGGRCSFRYERGAEGRSRTIIRSPSANSGGRLESPRTSTTPGSGSSRRPRSTRSTCRRWTWSRPSSNTSVRVATASAITLASAASWRSGRTALVTAVLAGSSAAAGTAAVRAAASTSAARCRTGVRRAPVRQRPVACEVTESA